MFKIKDPVAYDQGVFSVLATKFFKKELKELNETGVMLPDGTPVYTIGEHLIGTALGHLIQVGAGLKGAKKQSLMHGNYQIVQAKMGLAINQTQRQVCTLLHCAVKVGILEVVSDSSRPGEYAKTYRWGKGWMRRIQLYIKRAIEVYRSWKTFMKATNKSEDELARRFKNQEFLQGFDPEELLITNSS